MARAATQLKDPIADLMAEIEAEEQAAAAEAGKPAVARAAPVEEETDAEPPEEETAAEAEASATTDADGGDQAGKEAQKPDEEEVKPKPKKGKAKAEDEGWRARVNDAEVKRRKAEQEAAIARAELEALKNPKKDDPKKPPTYEELKAQAKQEAMFEMKVADFVVQGNSQYTQEAFDAACNRISDVIGVGKPSNIVGLALEATDTTAAAAKAVYLLGQNDVTEIEKFLAMSPLRQAAMLAKLSTTRGKAKDTEEEPRPKSKPRRIDDDETPPAPLRSVKGSTAVKDGMQVLYDDDADPAAWNKAFEEQVMNKGARH